MNTEEKRPMAEDFEGEKLPYPAKQSDMKQQPDSDLSNYKFVTEATRRVLQTRLNAPEMPPHFFDGREFETMKSLCDALAPSKVVPCRFVAGEIDSRHAENRGNGWRYAEMPTDAEVYRTALGEIDRIAEGNYGENFAALENQQRREILRRIKNMEAGFELSPDRFLEEICAEFVSPIIARRSADATRGFDIIRRSTRFT